MGIFILMYSLVPLTILLLVVVGCTRSIWITLMPPRGWNRGKGAVRVKGVSGEALCEKCRYPVMGLSGFQCPECGSDLRRTGIITRAMEMRRRGGLWSALIGITVLVGAGAAVGLTYLSYVLRPEAWNGGLVNSCTLSTPGGQGGVMSTISISTMEWNGMNGQASLMVNMGGGNWTNLTVDTANKTINGMMMPNGAGAGTGAAAGAINTTLDEPGLTSALAAAGWETTTELGKQQVTELLGLLKTVDGPKEKMFSTPSASFTGVTINLSPDGVKESVYIMVMWSAVGAVVLLWIVLVVLAARRRRRLLRAIDAAEEVQATGAAAGGAAPAVAILPPTARPDSSATGPTAAS